MHVTALFDCGSFWICSKKNDLYSISFSHEYTRMIPKLFPVKITSSFAVIEVRIFPPLKKRELNVVLGGNFKTSIFFLEFNL